MLLALPFGFILFSITQFSASINYLSFKLFNLRAPREGFLALYITFTPVFTICLLVHLTMSKFFNKLIHWEFMLTLIINIIFYFIKSIKKPEHFGSNAYVMDFAPVFFIVFTFLGVQMLIFSCFIELSKKFSLTLFKSSTKNLSLYAIAAIISSFPVLQLIYNTLPDRFR